MKSKVKNVNSLSKILEKPRSKGKRIVFTNGCFDIIHPGHVTYLAKASKRGDILVVGLNGDSSVRKIKGPGRPINNQNARALVLSALYFIDYVCVFNEATPEKLIKKLKPDVLVKGGDWPIKDIVGGEFVRGRGGKVVSIPFVKGYSTTALIKKISGDPGCCG